MRDEEEEQCEVAGYPATKEELNQDAADTAVSVARDDYPCGKASLPRLDQLGQLYGTDKSDKFHDYLNRYEPYFSPRRFEKLILLEIGIAGGASLRTWHSYFPAAGIIGVDHNMEYCHAMRKQNLPRLGVVHGEASSPDFWKAFRGSLDRGFDIVIDDASHYSSQVIATWQTVWPMVEPGGLYIIEDTHSAYVEPYKGSYTTIDSLRDMIDVMNEWGDKECGKSSDQTAISFIHLSKSLAIIGKRK